MINKIEFFKNKLATPFLVLFLLVNFNLLFNFPIPFIYEVLNILFFAFFLSFFLYITISYFKSKQVSRIYLLVLLLALVSFISAFQAMIYHGQPLIYGILTERLKILTVGGVFLVFLLEKGFLSMFLIEKVVIRFALFLFIVLLILNTLVPISLVENYGFVINSGARGYRIKFDNGLVVLLYFYALSKGFQEKKMKYILLLFLILFYFVFLFQARTLSISVILSTLVFLFFRLKTYKLISFGIMVSVVLMVSFGLGFLFFPNHMIQVSDLFASAFNVFLGGEINESSAMSRIVQFDIAKEGILNHPILGNGFISDQWQGGFKEVYGHFYPSDLGWIGALFLYGVLGLVIYFIPFILSLFYSYKFKKLKVLKSVFTNALIYTMLSFFILSTAAGFFVKKTGIILFVFSLIYYNYYNLKNSKNNQTA